MIIVLGGAGFLGQHLRGRLVAGQRRFTLVSPRFAPGLPALEAGERRMVLADFEQEEGCELLRSAHAIVNLISRSVPGTFAGEPWREMSENVAPLAAVFARCAAINPRAKLVHVSSGGTVYGRTERTLTPETAPCLPISGYGLGKVMIEEALRFTGRTTGMAYAILRVSNPVGRFQTSETQGIVSIALRASLSGATVRLLGDGSQVRDYLDADDVADAIVGAADDAAHPQATWNVGSGVGRSVVEVLDLVERITGRRLAVERLPARPVDVPRIVLDCGLIRRDLGWHAHRSLEEVVAGVFEGLRDRG